MKIKYGCHKSDLVTLTWRDMWTLICGGTVQDSATKVTIGSVTTGEGVNDAPRK